MSYDLWHQRQAASEATAAAPLYPWHRTALKLLPSLAGKRILEIGCGRGDFAIALAKANPTAEIVAVDFSEAAIQIAQAKLTGQPLKLSFATGDATKLTYPTSSFDWIISCECLEHIQKPEEMANEIARLLRVGGQFLLTTENYFNGMLLAWLKSWWTGQAFDSGSGVQAHENFFVFWKVRRLLVRSGLSITHEESNHFQWFLLPGCSPEKLRTNEFKADALNRLFRPFGRHFTFLGTKPIRDPQV